MDERKTIDIKVKFLMILCLIVIGVVAVFSFKENKTYNEAYKTNVDTIGRLNDKLTKIKRTEIKTGKAISLVLKDTGSVGKDIEDLQNNVLKNLDISTADGMEKYQTILNDYESYFAKDSLWARSSWFVIGNDPDNEFKDTEFEWSFKPTYSYSDEDVTLLWLCKDKSNGDLLAFAKALYKVDTKKLSDVSVGYTERGVEVMGVDVDENHDKNPVKETPNDGLSFEDYLKEFEKYPDVEGDGNEE